MIRDKEIPWKVVEMAIRLMDDNEEGVWGVDTLLYRLLLFRYENEEKLSGPEYFQDIKIKESEIALIELLNLYWDKG